jgi:hypothetical protein
MTNKNLCRASVSKRAAMSSLPDPRTHPDPFVRRGPFHRPTSYLVYIPAPPSNPNPLSLTLMCCRRLSLTLLAPATHHAPLCSSPSLVVAVSPLISLTRRGRTEMQGRAPDPGGKGDLTFSHWRSIRGGEWWGHTELVPLLPVAGHDEHRRLSSWTRRWRP